MPLVPFGGSSRRKQTVSREASDQVPTKVAGKAHKNKTVNGGKASIAQVVTDRIPGMPSRGG